MVKPGSVPGKPRPSITDAPAISNAKIDPRADPTIAPSINPALCGFVDGTSATSCEKGETCKFNTDYYAVGCCSNDDCEWYTRCCGFTPGPTPTYSVGTSLLANTCGHDIPSDSSMRGFCDSTNPYCGLHRWENGYTRIRCYTDPFSSTKSILFTSKGDTTAAPGLPRFTGSNGPPTQVTSTASSSSIVINQTSQAGSSENSTPSPGFIAGSAVGGAVVGALITLLAVFLKFYFRRRKGVVPEAQLSDVTVVPVPIYGGAGSPGYPAGTMTNEMPAFSSGRSSAAVAVGASYHITVASSSPGLKHGYNQESHPVEVVGSPGMHELSGSVQELDEGQRGRVEGRNA